MRNTLALLPIALLLAGCPTESGPQAPSCTVQDELPEGELHALVDGEEWVAEQTMFQVVAAGMMLGYNVDAHNTMTIRLRFASLFSIDEETGATLIEEGDEIQDIHDDRAAPADFSVGDGTRDGADVTLMIDDVTVHSGEASEEGFLRLVEYAEDEDTGAVTLLGCGWFDAAEQNGGDVEASMTGISFSMPIP
jgi:hypothetical protein